ncbi:unnamed protein product [Protopolystoma xenopodis]|uniref:Uncharacterized protein n=1 Tax=Protopolystoma xenopodis TaxID=117903 RepID=A0A3S5CSI0_9PLAT|nr:unnamed protein product [Protopolystoma xenopodis]
MNTYPPTRFHTCLAIHQTALHPPTSEQARIHLSLNVNENSAKALLPPSHLSTDPTTHLTTCPRACLPPSSYRPIYHSPILLSSYPSTHPQALTPKAQYLPKSVPQSSLCRTETGLHFTFEPRIPGLIDSSAPAGQELCRCRGRQPPPPSGGRIPVFPNVPQLVTCSADTYRHKSVAGRNLADETVGYFQIPMKSLPFPTFHPKMGTVMYSSGIRIWLGCRHHRGVLLGYLTHILLVCLGPARLSTPPTCLVFPMLDVAELRPNDGHLQNLALSAALLTIPLEPPVTDASRGYPPCFWRSVSAARRCVPGVFTFPQPIYAAMRANKRTSLLKSASVSIKDVGS